MADARLPLIASRTLLVRILIGLGFLGYVLARNMGAWAGGSDTSGYMNDARLLAAHALHQQQRTIDNLPPSSLPRMAYVPLGFLPTGKDEMYPTYPLGLPLEFLTFSKVFGWANGSHNAIWTDAMVCVVVVFLLLLELGVGREMSLLGAVVFGASSLFLFLSLQAMSDMPATLCAAFAALCALWSRRHPAWAILCGLSFAYGVVVRPTNALMAVPLALMLPMRPATIAAFVGGVIPWALWDAHVSHEVYGAAVTTGYGDVSSLFGLRYLAPTLRNYGSTLWTVLTPLVLLAAAFPFVRTGLGWRLKAALIAWILLFFGFYSVYFCTHDTWWYLRFVLPAFPPLIAAVLFVIRRFCPWRPLLQAALWTALVALVLKWDVRQTRDLYATSIGRGERVYFQASKFIRRTLSERDAIFCMQGSGAFFYYTKNPLLRWDAVGAKDFQRVELQCRATGRKVYMVLFPFEEEEAFRKYPGARWDKVAMVRDMGIWKLQM